MMSRYRVMVDENSHYMDEDERWELGTFETADAAIAVCRRMVDDDLREIHKPGMSAAELITRYQAFGDDPFVVAIDGAPTVDFSAWDYAEQRAAEICG